MNNALQQRVGQDASTHVQPCAILRAPTGTQLRLPVNEYPTPTQLSATTVRLLATYGAVKVYPKSMVLTYAGSPSTSCFVVLSGRIRVFVSDDSGRELTLTMPGPGEPWGDIGLIEEMPSAVTAVTLVPSTLVVVSRTRFLACLAEHPDLAAQFLHLAAQRIGHLTSLAKNLAFAKVYSRMLDLLSALAQEREGALVVEQRLTHQEIADMIGATRETVSRVMRELHDSGAITVANGRIRVLVRSDNPPGTVVHPHFRPC